MTAQPDTSLIEQIHRDVIAMSERLGNCGSTLDVLFLCYLRRLSRFGYFTCGPVTIDVDLIEDIVERTAVPGDSCGASEDYIRYTRLLMQEVQRSGRKRVDERHFLLAFARCGEGLPARVFGELGVTPEQIEASFREPQAAMVPSERLMTPEEVATYLQVHVETVRGWIRSGKLPALRVAGLRALRVQYTDVIELLKPLDEVEGAQATETPARNR